MKREVKTRIRAAKQADLRAINDIFNYYVQHSTCVWICKPTTAGERLKWYKAHGGKMPVLVAESGGRVVGWASLGTFREAYTRAGTVEDSVYVHHDFQRKGIGSALLTKLIAGARKNGYRSILAHISGDQRASIKLHQTLGFRKVGRFRKAGNKLGKQLDAVFMQLLLR